MYSEEEEAAAFMLGFPVRTRHKSKVILLRNVLYVCDAVQLCCHFLTFEVKKKFKLVLENFSQKRSNNNLFFNPSVNI